MEDCLVAFKGQIHCHGNAVCSLAGGCYLKIHQEASLIGQETSCTECIGRTHTWVNEGGKCVCFQSDPYHSIKAHPSGHPHRDA